MLGPEPHHAPADPVPPARAIPSEDLLRGQKMVFIDHAGERYRLLVTRNDKLILQK